MPEPPRNFDELVDALRDHPEWRRDLRGILATDGPEPEPPPPPDRSRMPRWLPTLGMGVLIGAIVAGVAVFVLARNDDDDDSVAAAATPEATSGSPAVGPSGTPTPAPSPSPSGSASATPVAPSPTPVPESPSPATSTAPASPAPATQQPAPATPATATSTASPASASPVAAGPPRFTFAGFEGICAPVLAVLHIENISEATSVGGSWTREGGSTVITVAPLLIEPVPPGSVVTVRFPTVSPLTPGRYTFAAIADGVVVAMESTNINC